MTFSTGRPEQEQFEIGLFMDLSQFDELERKVSGVIARFRELRDQNAELQDRIRILEKEVHQRLSENERLTAEREELRLKQRDEQKEGLIRQKVQELLNKLEGLESLSENS